MTPSPAPRRALAALLIAALGATAAMAPVASAGEPSEAERKACMELADDLVEYAATCAGLRARSEGLRALEEARGLNHLALGIPAAERALEAVTAEDPESAGLEKRRKALAPAVARAYDRLAALPRDAKTDGARTAGFLAGSLRWEPTDTRRRKALAAVEDEMDSGRLEGGGALLSAIKAADGDGEGKGKYDAFEVALGQKDRLVLGSTATPLLALVSLPKGWTKGKRYPVLVCVEGAGCDFRGQFAGFATARGSRPLIVVTPLSLSNTNALEPAKYPAYPKALLDNWNGNRIDFDGPGLLAILDDLGARFGAEPRVFTTGFSGGGNLSYWLLLRHPERVRGAAPACANFSGHGLDGAPGAGDGGGPPVHLLTGEKDPHRVFTFGNKDIPGIEPQTDAVERELKRLGYGRVRRTMVPGAGHSPLRKEVLDFVDEVLAGK